MMNTLGTQGKCKIAFQLFRFVSMLYFNRNVSATQSDASFRQSCNYIYNERFKRKRKIICILAEWRTQWEHQHENIFQHKQKLMLGNCTNNEIKHILSAKHYGNNDEMFRWHFLCWFHLQLQTADTPLKM